jgi:hypothetical protein
MPAIRRLLPCFPLLLACACSGGRMDVVGLSPNSLRLGMVALWSCDRDGQPTLSDMSGNGHDGSIDGAIWIDGRFGGGLRLGATGAVAVPGFPQATRSFSVALWYRAADGEADDTYRTVLGTELTSIGGWDVSVRPHGTSPAVRFQYPVGSDASVASEHLEAEHLDFQRWTHLVTVLDASMMTLALYYDGNRVAEAPIEGLIQPGSTTLAIGRPVGSAPSLDGDVDDIAIFNRALVPAEVAELYARPAPLP